MIYCEGSFPPWKLDCRLGIRIVYIAMSDPKWVPVLFVISILQFNEINGNHILLSEGDTHLRQESLPNVIRTIRSKVGRPEIVEVWEKAISDGGEYPVHLNRIRRSIVEIQGPEKQDESRTAKSLSKQSSIDVPANDLQEPRFFNDHDQIHVVSSAIRVISKKDSGNKDGEQVRQKRNEYRNEYQWRRPRTQFVTRTERMSSLAPRYQFPPERTDRYLLDNEIVPSFRRSSLPQRRIIYYATLPEIVRPPVNPEWQQLQQQHQQLQQQPQQLQPQPLQQQPQPQPQPQPQQSQSQQPQPQQSQQLQQLHPFAFPTRPQQPIALESRPYYPIVRDNEVTRVQSSVIDVTNRDSPTSPSQTPTIISSVLASPKYTIIDAEPPPYYSNAVRPYYNNYPYNVRYPQPYYNYNSNRYNYYDDVRTPPYRIQQTFQPPYYSKPEYIPVESPPAHPTSSSSLSSHHNSTETDQMLQISTTNSTKVIDDKDSNENKRSSSSNNNLINSRYL